MAEYEGTHGPDHQLQAHYMYKRLYKEATHTARVLREPQGNVSAI
jgi:hypothetical protein